MEYVVKEYEPSRLLYSFHIRGFQFWDGALVLDEMRAGNKLALKAEIGNPHDPEAVAVYYGNTKLGFVPAEESSLYSQLLFFGHHDVLEARVLQIDCEAEPWKQVRAGIYITDKRS